MSANQNVIGTLVQVPDSINVKNRLLTNAFRVGAPVVYLPTLLKKQFDTTSKFSIQNASTSTSIDFVVYVYNISNPSNPYISDNYNLPAGSVKYFMMGEGTIAEGSYGDPNTTYIPAVDGTQAYAVVKGYVAGTQTQSPIVATVFELTQTDYNFSARAYEGIASGATTIYMATALCRSNSLSTAYAIQNITNSSVTVLVTYSGDIPQLATIPANGKVSLKTCDVITAPNSFSGAAKITATGGQIVAIGKAYWDSSSSNPSYGTAFIGETQGSAKLAFPYVRYTQDSTYNNGSRQRAYLAIQNVGSSTVTNIQVKYLNSAGTLLGTHPIASIAANGKANSNAIQATPTAQGDADRLKEFGYPESNPGGASGGVYGGAVLIEASSGSQLVAVARLQTRNPNTTLDVAEDYNAVPVQ